ncbi:hypothetical protein Ddc_14570 [Ditylenchus destructor]|nr:hypothetical protein Ddc_14570 [Ditylenchus destructor]
MYHEGARRKQGRESSSKSTTFYSDSSSCTWNPDSGFMCDTDSGSNYCWDIDMYHEGARRKQGQESSSKSTSFYSDSSSYPWNSDSGFMCDTDSGSNYCWDIDMYHEGARRKQGQESSSKSTSFYSDSSSYPWNSDSGFMCDTDSGSNYCWDIDMYHEGARRKQGQESSSKSTSFYSDSSSYPWNSDSGFMCDIDSGSNYCWDIDMYHEGARRKQGQESSSKSTSFYSDSSSYPWNSDSGFMCDTCKKLG